MGETKKLLVKDIIESYDLIQYLSSIDIEDIDFVYNLSMISDGIKEVKNSYEKARGVLLKSLGTEEEKGYFNIPEENVKKYNSKLEELLNKEVDLILPSIKYEYVKGNIKQAKFLKIGIDKGIILPKE